MNLGKRLVEVQFAQLEFLPVARRLQKLLPFVGLLELDFYEVHIRLAEELHVFSRGGRSGLELLIEVQEERSGRVIRFRLSIEPAQHALAFAGWCGGQSTGRGGEMKKGSPIHSFIVQPH